MKNLLCLIIALVFVCSAGTPIAATVNNPPAQTIQRNEYVHRVFGDEEMGARSAGDLKAVFQKRSEYVGELRKAAQNPADAIRAMGYSQEMTRIILQMKQNPQYAPMDTELSRAAATVTMEVRKISSVHIGNQTHCTLGWSFSWSARPFFVSKDVLGIAWNDHFVVVPDLVAANIEYVSEHNSSITKSVDKGSQMKRNVSASSNTIGLSFPMRIETTPEYNFWWAKSGSGSFTVRCSSHFHSQIAVNWAYGHRDFRLTTSSSHGGIPLKGIGFGISTAADGYKDIAIYDDL